MTNIATWNIQNATTTTKVWLDAVFLVVIFVLVYFLFYQKKK